MLFRSLHRRLLEAGTLQCSPVAVAEELPIIVRRQTDRQSDSHPLRRRIENVPKKARPGSAVGALAAADLLARKGAEEWRLGLARVALVCVGPS